MHKIKFWTTEILWNLQMHSITHSTTLRYHYLVQYQNVNNSSNQLLLKCQLNRTCYSKTSWSNCCLQLDANNKSTTMKAIIIHVVVCNAGSTTDNPQSTVTNVLHTKDTVIIKHQHSNPRTHWVHTSISLFGQWWKLHKCYVPVKIHVVYVCVLYCRSITTLQSVYSTLLLQHD